jgi:hypothetical protein
MRSPTIIKTIIKLSGPRPRDKHSALWRGYGMGSARDPARQPGSQGFALPSHKSAAKTSKTRRWSSRVTRESNALDLDRSVFTWKDPRRIARSLERSAERSHRRKAEPYRSAMSMLTFYINRAGKGLSQGQRRVLERAKGELRHLYGRVR